MHAVAKCINFLRERKLKIGLEPQCSISILLDGSWLDGEDDQCQFVKRVIYVGDETQMVFEVTLQSIVEMVYNFFTNHIYNCMRTSNFWEGRTVMSQFWLHMDHSISQLVPMFLRGNSINCLGLYFETRRLINGTSYCVLKLKMHYLINYFPWINFILNKIIRITGKVRCIRR